MWPISWQETPAVLWFNPCYWWETGDPSTLTAPIFENEPVVCKQVKNKYAALHLLNSMVPKSLVYFSTPQMRLHMEAFGQGRTYLEWGGGDSQVSLL